MTSRLSCHSRESGNLVLKSLDPRLRGDDRMVRGDDRMVRGNDRMVSGDDRMVRGDNALIIDSADGMWQGTDSA